MKAADVMRYRVVTTAPDASLVDAARTMLKHHVSGLPVVDSKGRVVGMVTEGDLLRRTETGTERHRPSWLEFLLGPGRLADEYAHTHGRKVGEVMTERVIAVGPSTPLEALVALMEKNRIKRIPVIDGGKLVGIVSRADLMGLLAHLAPHASETSPSDAEIRRRILAEFDMHPWALRGCLDAIVENGVVELRGVIADERQRQALKIAAENVDGVKEIVDRLTWVEPVSGMAFGPNDMAGG